MRRGLVVWLAAASSCLAQAPRTPNLEAQRSAMKKLEFLVGKWSGTASVWRGAPEMLELTQTEEAQFKLDGLVLMIEGNGQSRSDGKPVLRALGLVSYDDESGVYRMRAFNDGRYMETEMRLATDGKGLTWGFTIGGIRTSSTLRI